MWQGWQGSLPDWLTLIPAVFGGLAVVFAAQQLRAERIREGKTQATGLVSWAVTDADSAERVYGILVDNTSDSMFHSVVIDAVMHGERCAEPVRLGVLPPGRYFVKLNGPKAKWFWDFAIVASSYHGELRPYMQSPKYLVTSMRFRDNLNQQWTTDEHAVLSLRNG